MRVACPSCKTQYNIDDARIPPGGAKLKCAKCQTTFPLRANEAVPLPGTGAPRQEAVPLPGRTGEAAVPLPGTGFPALTAAVPAGLPRWDQQQTRIVPGSEALA